MTRPLSILLFVLFASAACAAGDDGGACKIGTIEACACADGSTAKRVCTDARVWTPCACREPDVVAPPDDGGPEPVDVAEPLEDLPTPDHAEPSPDPWGEILDAEPAPDAEGADVPDEAVPEAGPEPFEIQYPDNCEPQCGARECGPDGCGSTCGTCDCGHECQQGACVWIACEGRQCGPDESGCGVLCGGCYAHAGSQCTEIFGGSQCGCQADCSGKQCGDDGCGGSCGTCQVGVCNANGKCVPDCTPSCSGQACGSNGCGGSCGLCVQGRHCSPDNQCVECLSSADCVAPLACLSKTCVPVAP